MSRVDRRAFLRGVAIGGGGLLAAYAVGCKGSGGGTPAPTATAQPTAMPPADATPAPTEAAPSAGWQRIEASGLLPPPRRDHSLVTDGDTLYLFGGRGDETYGDLWTYSFASGEWSELPAAGPAARFGHNAVFDPAAGRMIVFGGQAGGFFDDAWALDAVAVEWTELLPGGTRPAPRYGAASALDPGRGFVISHGFTGAGRFDDSWGIDAGSLVWTDLSPEGDRPLKRCLTRAVWDGQALRLLMFGGQSNETPYLGDTWELNSEGWRELTGATGPAPRHFYAMAFAEDTRRIALFGGRTANGEVNDTWLFDAATDSWSELVAGDAPSPRSGHDAVWIPASGSLVVFGGEDDSGNLNDLWELSLPA